MPCDYSRYPPDWPAIRARILKRAGYRCESCGVRRHAVGYREADGYFMAAGGNLLADAAGSGQHPSGEPLSYAEAREFCEVYNCCSDGRDDDGNRWIVIVLTVGHLDEGDLDCPDDRLKAWCQRCHNRYDAAMRRRHAKETRQRRKREAQPCLSL